MPVPPQLAHIHDRTKPSEGVDRAMYFCNLALELSFGVTLENLVGTVWAQQVPKWTSWSLCWDVYFPKLAWKLLFGVVLKNLVEASSAQHGPK